jgi:hypothetical protein
LEWPALTQPWPHSARHLLESVDAQLRIARLQRRATQRPLVYKVRENALVAPRLRYHVTDNAPWR